MNGTKQLVTGGAGFIGSHLCERLLSEGATVTCYDNLVAGKRAWVEPLLKNPKFSFVQGDILNAETLRSAMKGADVVWHLAANGDIQRGTAEPRLDLEQNTIGTATVLEAMHALGVKQILFSSSATVYGESIVHPAREDAGPTLPVSLYGAAKMAGEGLITSYCHLYDMRAWIFRFANVIGPRMGHGVLYDFIAKLRKNPQELEVLGNGKQEKPFFLIEDCIGGMRHAYDHSKQQYDLFNLGVASTTTVTEIAHIVIEEMALQGVRIRYTGGERGWPGDVPRLFYDVSKMKKLGWEASHTSSEAVRIGVRRLLTHM